MNQEIYNVSWEETLQGVKNILDDIKKKDVKVDTVVPILRGGATLGNLINNNLESDISFMHIRRSNGNEQNASFGTPVLKGITNEEYITGKNILIVDDLLDKGVTIDFAIEEIKKRNPKNVHVAVLYNFTKLENQKMYSIGLSMDTKKWIVFPWEVEIK